MQARRGRQRLPLPSRRHSAIAHRASPLIAPAITTPRATARFEEEANYFRDRAARVEEWLARLKARSSRRSFKTNSPSPRREARGLVVADAPAYPSHLQDGFGASPRATGYRPQSSRRIQEAPAQGRAAHLDDADYRAISTPASRNRAQSGLLASPPRTLDRNAARRNLGFAMEEYRLGARDAPRDGKP
jgi:hypothetical protein